MNSIHAGIQSFCPGVLVGSLSCGEMEGGQYKDIDGRAMMGLTIGMFTNVRNISFYFSSSGKNI